MAPRAREWSKEEEGHRVQMVWPKSLWKEVRRMALEEDKSATELVIETVQMLLASRRKEGGRKSEKKK